MTDIVAKLRSETNGGGMLRWCDPRVANEAAIEIERLRRGWLRIIQGENGCATTGSPCDAKRCGCVEERELLADD